MEATKAHNKFSYFKAPIKNTIPINNEMTLERVKNAIISDFAKDSTHTLRSIQDIDEAKSYKGKSFDYVTFSGVFSKRSSDSLISYSGLICLDFDHVNIDETKSKILNQSEVDTALLFVSPSGDGVKWVVPATNAEEHQEVFQMYESYCLEVFGLEIDKACKDISRACFLPYDPGVIYNDSYIFRKIEKHWNRPKENEKDKKSERDRFNSSDSSFDDYNKRGDVLSLLLDYGWKIDTQNSENIQLIRPGKKTGNGASLRLSDKLFHVFTSGDKYFNANETYNPVQVFTILECGGDYKEADIQLRKLGFGLKEKERKSKLSDDRPIYLDKDGKLDAYLLSDFLLKNNIMRISITGDDRLNIFHVDNKIMKMFNPKTETISFLTQKLTQANDKGTISNLIYSQRQAVKEVFQLMPGVSYDLQRDTKDEVYIPFKNGVARITSEGVKMLDFEDNDIKHFAEVESQNHDFVISDFENRTVGNFEKFILYAVIGRVARYDEISEAEKRNVTAFYSMIGYLISDYKNPAKTPAIILSDDGADDVSRKGRRGKTILTKSIQIFKYSMFRGGKEFDPTYRHNFANLDQRVKLFVLDDVPAGFDFDALYTQIAGDITSEKKGVHAVTIPFRDAPKFVITTNWAVRYDKTADSTNDRFKEYKFSYFWNIDNKPDIFFQELFFEDWESEQWQLFFEFMTMCVNVFLSQGLKEITYSKEDDNFKAYFSNDVTLDEFERIWKRMTIYLDDKGYFTTTDFLDFHNEKYRNPIFHKNNANRHICAYSEKYGLGIAQDDRRHWIRNKEAVLSEKEFIPF